MSVLSRVKGNVLERDSGWGTVSRNVGNRVLDVGHMIPEFAFRIPGLWREMEQTLKWLMMLEVYLACCKAAYHRKTAWSENCGFKSLTERLHSAVS